MNPGLVCEVMVLRPKLRLVEARGGEDDAVGHGQVFGPAPQGCRRRHVSIGVDDAALYHLGNATLGIGATALFVEALVDLVQRDGRNDERADVLDRRRETRGVRPVGEIFEAAGGVDDVGAGRVRRGRPLAHAA